LVEKKVGTGVLLPQGDSFITLAIGRNYYLGNLSFWIAVAAGYLQIPKMDGL
jgi:hypothetical protein